MKRKGFTLVEIMIVVAIIALLAAIAIPNLLRARINAAQAYAQASLRTISTAYESYATTHDGSYNVTLTSLANKGEFDPPYLNKDFSVCTLDDPCQGYSFTCTSSAGSYECKATPAGAFADKKVDSYLIETGGNLTVVEVAGEPAT